MRASNIMQAIQALRWFSFFCQSFKDKGKRKLTLIRMRWTAYHVKPEPGQWVICFKPVITLETS